MSRDRTGRVSVAFQVSLDGVSMIAKAPAKNSNVYYGLDQIMDEAARALAALEPNISGHASESGRVRNLNVAMKHLYAIRERALMAQQGRVLAEE